MWSLERLKLSLLAIPLCERELQADTAYESDGWQRLPGGFRS
jgi:hypothetical protein